MFNLHYVVHHIDDKYYDPSYGVTYDTESDLAANLDYWGTNVFGPWRYAKSGTGQGEVSLTPVFTDL